MKITLKSLQEKEVHKTEIGGFIEWFRENFGEEAESDNVIKKLHDIKDTRRLTLWLFVKYKLSGLCEKWWDDGQLIYRTNFKDGKAHGLCKWWFENGQLEYRLNYKDGKRHGLCESWLENGQLKCRENYKDGKRHGLWESWYDNGQLEGRSNFKDGKLIN